MSEVIVYGNPLSTYTRTARMALVEKGVEHALEPVDYRAPEYRAIHPFARIPAMRHGDFVLYETLAIATYVDDVFDGPPLAPSDARDRAHMYQWISATLDYLYESMVRKLVFERLVAKAKGRAPDEALVAQSLPEVEHQVGVLNTALEATPYLAGQSISIADMFVLPVLFYVNFTAEGRRFVAAAPAVGAWLERVGARASADTTLPPVGKLTA